MCRLCFLVSSLLVLTTIPSTLINVFVSEVDLFDYREGEPSPEYSTILRVLDVGSSTNLA